MTDFGVSADCDRTRRTLPGSETVIGIQ